MSDEPLRFGPDGVLIELVVTAVRSCAYCRGPIAGHPLARYCSPRCSRNAEYHRNAERERAAARMRARVVRGWDVARLDAPARPYGVPPAPRREIVPLIDAPTGHPCYEAARAQLKPYERAELGSGMDSIARDLLQEYALASFDGGDPEGAVASFRQRHQRDRAVLVYGTLAVTDLGR